MAKDKDKRTPKEALEMFEQMVKTAVSGKPKPSKTKWIQITDDTKLTEEILFYYGFMKLEKAFFQQDDIDIAIEGKNKFYCYDKDRNKKYLKTVGEMKQLFIDAGKVVPNLIDPSPM